MAERKFSKAQLVAIRRALDGEATFRRHILKCKECTIPGAFARYCATGEPLAMRAKHARFRMYDACGVP